MRHILASISQRLRVPSVCVICNQYHHGPVAMCTACHTLLTPLGPSCYHCARPLPESDFLVCGHCCIKKPHYDQVIAATRFEEPIRSLLHEFKYHEGLYLSAFFSRLIVNAISPESLKTQCLIPVPMHSKRLRLRGFNHAAELVKQLGATLGLPYELSHCKKTINTVPQASLDAKHRQQNLRNVFSVKPLPYQHITLVDDLITTGSTANEIAKTFKKQGVKRVDVWCCSRA